MNLSRKKWIGTKYKVSCCKTIIQSRYPGEFSRCVCGKTFVDENQHMGRRGGNPTTIFEPIKLNVVFVGQSPSLGNTDPTIPFIGTKSERIINNWLLHLGLHYDDCAFFNASDEIDSNKANLPLLQEKITPYINKRYRVVALGVVAKNALKKLNISCLSLPHPSPKNRKLNNKSYVEYTLQIVKNSLELGV